MSDSKYPADLPVSQVLVLEHLADIAAALRENTAALIKSKEEDAGLLFPHLASAPASRRERR